MMEIFEEKALPYQLRYLSNLKLRKVGTPFYGTNTVGLMGKRVLAKLPTEIKTSVSLRAFKNISSQQNVSITIVGFVKLLYIGYDFYDYHAFLLHCIYAFVNSRPKLAFVFCFSYCK